MKKLLKPLQITLIIAIVIASSFGLHAQQKLDKINKSGVIKVGMTGNQPPFTMKARDGSYMGYEVDLAQLMAESMGLELEIVAKPFEELIPALEKGEVDIVMSGMAITAERNMKVPFVGPYLLTGKTFLSKSATLANVDEAGDVNRPDIKTTALNKSTSQEFVKVFLDKTTFIGAKDYDEAVQNLLTDKADILIADYPICVLTMLRYPKAGLVTSEVPFLIEPIGIAVAPKDPLFLNFVENYFKALELAGVLDELEEYWFNNSSWLMNMK